MANDRYDTRYCAFIDILGFSDLIGEVRRGKKAFSEVRQILQKIHEPIVLDASQASSQPPVFQVQSISDAVAISTKASQLGSLVLLGTVERIVRSLLAEGYFTRGAICRGKLYHDEKTVFGDALINAYRLESQVARYPRIMVTKEVFEESCSIGGRGRVSERIIQARDGPYYLHVLLPLQQKLTALMERKKANIEGEGDLNFKFYEEIQLWIIKRIGEAVDEPKHFEKALWFADYWNRTVDPVLSSRVMHIEGAGLPSYYPPLIDNAVR